MRVRRPAPPLDDLGRLSRGRHKDPADGACLLEAASVLAGERWTDRPAGVHPVLAAVARRVNDETSPAGRDALLPLAARVLGTADADPGASARVVDACARAALASSRGSARGDVSGGSTAARRPDLARRRALARAVRRARRRCRRGPETTRAADLTELLYCRVVAPEQAAEATTALARTSGGERDEVLRRLLTTCVALCEPDSAARG